MKDQDTAVKFADYQRAKGLSDTTILNRAGIIRRYENAAGKPALELSVFELRAQLGRPGIAASSRRTERNSLLAFYQFAQEEELRVDNPAARLPTVRVPRPEPRPYSAEQIDRLLASGAYRRSRAMILIGYYQGFRAASIAGIHGRDIDLESETITTIVKGAKTRTVPLHPVVLELAQTMPRDAWWFPARYGREGHILPRSVSDLLYRAKRRAAIADPKLTGHSLRHSFGSDLVESGVDIRVVQELMTHDNISSTQIYTRVSERRKRDGIAVLAARTIPLHAARHAA